MSDHPTSERENRRGRRATRGNRRQQRGLSRAITSATEGLKKLHQALESTQADRRLVKTLRTFSRDLSRFSRDLQSLPDDDADLRGVRDVTVAARRVQGVNYSHNSRQSEQAMRQFGTIFLALSSMAGELPPPAGKYSSIMRRWSRFFAKNSREIVRAFSQPADGVEQRDNRQGRRRSRGQNAA